MVADMARRLLGQDKSYCSDQCGRDEACPALLAVGVLVVEWRFDFGCQSPGFHPLVRCKLRPSANRIQRHRKL